MTLGQVIVRFLVAAACGAIIGLHFELRGRPGGLRTHVQTTLGAGLFCATAASLGEPGVAASRAIQGIASGVGFIGAAVVLRRGGHVHGITNAASLWIAAAIGCETGLGDLRIALMVAAFVAATNSAAMRLERWLRRRKALSSRRTARRRSARRLPEPSRS